MRIESVSAPHAARSTTSWPTSPDAATLEAPGTGSGTFESVATWTNPAAAAALHTSVDLLNEIEAGILRNFSEAERVRGFATDLRSTMSVFDSAVSAITSDDSKENDQFLPLLDSANGGVNHAQLRLASKELATTWPTERNDILAAIRKARSISQNVADQLDPRGGRG